MTGILYKERARLVQDQQILHLGCEEHRLAPAGSLGACIGGKLGHVLTCIQDIIGP